VRRGHAGAAIGPHVGNGAQGGEAAGEFGGTAEGAVRVHIVSGRRADGAGDVARDRVDGLVLSPVPLPRPRVEQEPGLGRRRGARRVQHRHVTRARGEVARLRGLIGLADREVGRQPSLVPAVEDPHVLVPVVTQQPPGSGGGGGVPVVVDHHRTVLAHPGRAHRLLEGGRVGQRVPSAGAGRPGQVTVQVDEDGAGQVTLPVNVQARRPAEAPAHVQQDGCGPAGEFVGESRG
jgi:hypothetical protein